MSESFESILRRVNYGKFIDQIQGEIARTLPEIKSSKGAPNVELLQDRLTTLVGKLSKDLSKEVGLVGAPITVFMISMSVVSTAWVAFKLRAETSDLSKSPEDRLVMIEMLDALDLALASVVSAASTYADTSPEGSKPT